MTDYRPSKLRGRVLPLEHRQKIAKSLRGRKRKGWAKAKAPRKLAIRRGRGSPPGWSETLNACRREDDARVKWIRQIWYYYELTVEDYARLWHRQGGRCAICEKPLKNGTGGAGVDHNHKTGTVRGLLCAWCNYRILPIVEQAGHLLPRALAYLGRLVA